MKRKYFLSMIYHALLGFDRNNLEWVESFLNFYGFEFFIMH